METVLVLNFDYTPLNVTSIRRGFVLVDKGKAEILKEYDNPIITTVGRLVKPLIIRLLKFINYHNKKDLKISRQRIYQRDGFQCVYCGTHKNLTIDHVMPKSRGGANSWENMVTCCFTCNSKKGSKTPEEANMSMRVRPYKPSVFSELVAGRAANIWQSLQKEIFN
jgi:CRISPR/Cas system Type II protein with McrA/HNH and RuvC-like nuclease domain